MRRGLIAVAFLAGCVAAQAQTTPEAMHEAGIQASMDGAQEDAEAADAAVAPVVKAMSAAQRAAYDKASKTVEDLIGATVTGDTLFTGGYGSGGLYPDEMRAAFENAVVDAAKEPPAASTRDKLAVADGELNTVYKRLLTSLAGANGERTRGITVDGLRGEERAWLRYRDAFVALGSALHTGSNEHAWMLALTGARAQDLKQVCDAYCDQMVQQRAADKDWARALVTDYDGQEADARAQVAQYFDRQTPSQSVAWAQVMKAMDGFVAAHRAVAPTPDPIFRQRKMLEMYGEVYAISYNREHHFPMDAAKVDEAAKKLDAQMNQVLKENLDGTCSPKGAGSSVAGLQQEQAAWARLREAWVEFLATLFHHETRPALGNMFTGGRTFELEMMPGSCRLKATEQ